MHAADDVFDLRDRPLLSTIARRWPPIGTRHHIVRVLDQDLAHIADRLAYDLRVFFADVDVEERRRNDLECECVELESHVAPLALSPSIEHPLGKLHHRRRVRIHALLVKPWKDELVLPFP